MTRLLLVVLALVGGTVVTSTVTAAPAAALCVASPLDGDWHNINSAAGMSRLIAETCQSVTTCSGGVCSTAFDSGTFLTPFGRCHPTDCNWGRRLADHPGDGWVRTIHNFGFKTSHVWVRNYTFSGVVYLRVWVNNDFSAADGRTDYVTDDWFLK